MTKKISTFFLSTIATLIFANALSPTSLAASEESFIQEAAVEKKFISWEEFNQDTLTLAQELKQHGPWNGIIAIARGGLVPAAILAQALEIKVIDTLCTSSYEDSTQTKTSAPIVLNTAEEKPGRWLIVDDLVDTGHTAKIAKDLFPSATVVCVYAKPKGEPFTTFYAKKMPQSTWVVFPWEKD